MLSYRRQTALQGALVLSKSEGKLQVNILRTLEIYLQSQLHPYSPALSKK